MATVPAYDVIAGAIQAEGSGVVFALMGDGNMLFLASLATRHGVRIVNVRHENAAVAMADGWARSSGRVGVCSVTCGPGLTQVATALTAAVRNRTALVLIVGDVPVGTAWNPQRTDQGVVTASTGARYMPVGALSMLSQTITEAFIVAEQDRTAVVVSIPYDLQEQVLEEYVPPEPAHRPPAPPAVAPAAADVSAAVDVLAEAKRPLIVAGRGAVRAGARDPIVGLAARTGALLGTTLLARDWFRSEPFDVGLVGGLSSRTTRELVGEADVVLAIGASLGYFATDNGILFDGKQVIQVDSDPRAIHEGVRAATCYVRGDALQAVTALDSALAARGHEATGFHTAATAERLARPLPEYPLFDPEPGTVDPVAVIEALDASLPAEALLVYGVGHFWSFAVMGLHRGAPDDHLHAYGFGAVGHGLPTAVGAAIASGRPVVLIEGDGSLLMHIGELATLKFENLDLLVFAMNDGGFGSEIHKLNFKHEDGEIARFGRLDFGAVAQGFGISGHRLSGPSEVPSLVARHFGNDGPTVIDVPMSRDALSAPTRRNLFPNTLPPGNE